MSSFSVPKMEWLAVEGKINKW